MCGCFCIKFIDYMLDDKSLIDYTNLFSPQDFKKKDKIIKDIIINQNIYKKKLYNFQRYYYQSKHILKKMI